MNKGLLEIACFSAEAAIIAAGAGANRIELCKNYCVGGLTPDFETITSVLTKVKVPVRVIIRPREGDFCYSEPETESMLKSIRFCSLNGVEGIVIGALDKEKEVDSNLCKILMAEAGKMNITFHRAIDACKDIQVSVQNLIALGVNTVLTSGGAPHALAGQQTIKNLNSSYGKLIKVLPGGGVRASNLQKLVEGTNCYEYHSAASRPGSELPSPDEIVKMLEILNT